MIFLDPGIKKSEFGRPADQKGHFFCAFLPLLEYSGTITCSLKTASRTRKVELGEKLWCRCKDLCSPSSKKQEWSRIRPCGAPNGGFEGRGGGKTPDFFWKVSGKLGSRNRDTDWPNVIHLTRAKREPCNGALPPALQLR